MCLNIFKPKPKPKPPVFPVDKTGYELVFSDDFDVPQAFPNDKWETMECYGNPVTHSLIKNDPPDDYVIWKPSQVRQANNNCILTNDLNTASGEPQIKAGMITTFKSCVQKYGYWEVKMKVAKDGIDNYSGVWLVGLLWDGEIDFAEFMNLASNQFTSSVHKRVDGVMQLRDTQIITSKVDLSLDYHIYAVDWQPTYINFYLDNILVYSYTGNYIPDIPMYLIVQIAVKNGYKPNGTLSFPNECLVEYVKIYKKVL